MFCFIIIKLIQQTPLQYFVKKRNRRCNITIFNFSNSRHNSITNISYTLKIIFMTYDILPWITNIKLEGKSRTQIRVFKDKSKRCKSKIKIWNSTVSYFMYDISGSKIMSKYHIPQSVVRGLNTSVIIWDLIRYSLGQNG